MAPTGVGGTCTGSNAVDKVIIVRDDLKCPNFCGPCYLLRQEFALETSFYKWAREDVQ